jgi:hypothetical protein
VPPRDIDATPVEDRETRIVSEQQAEY